MYSFIPPGVSVKNISISDDRIPGEDWYTISAHGLTKEGFAIDFGIRANPTTYGFETSFIVPPTEPEKPKTLLNLKTSEARAREFFYLIFDTRHFVFTNIASSTDGSADFDVQGKSYLGQLVNIYVNPVACSVAVYPLQENGREAIRRTLFSFGYDVSVWVAKEDPFGTKETAQPKEPLKTLDVIGFENDETAEGFYETVLPDCKYTGRKIHDNPYITLHGYDAESKNEKVDVYPDTNIIRVYPYHDAEQIQNRLKDKGYDIRVLFQ